MLPRRPSRLPPPEACSLLPGRHRSDLMPSGITQLSGPLCRHQAGPGFNKAAEPPAAATLCPVSLLPSLAALALQTNNEEAIRFYSRFGFEVAEVRGPRARPTPRRMPNKSKKHNAAVRRTPLSSVPCCQARCRATERAAEGMPASSGIACPCSARRRCCTAVPSMLQLLRLCRQYRGTISGWTPLMRCCCASGCTVTTAAAAQQTARMRSGAVFVCDGIARAPAQTPAQAPGVWPCLCNRTMAIHLSGIELKHRWGA